MENVIYLDMCSTLGRHMRMTETQPETPEALLAEMDHCGIHEALVVDALARETNPMAGNERILERTRNHPRLIPAWAGLMSHSQELPPPRDLVARMRESGVGALFLFYGQFDIRLEEWGIDDLLSALEESRVPVVLSPESSRQPGRTDATDWTNVVRICRRFPQLPVIVTESRVYKSQRAVYSALAACPNLRIDISALWLHQRIEFICREFGAERLVWGSQLPQRCAAVPMMQLNYSDISHQTLFRIAGGNMRQLLSWNKAIRFAGESVRFPEPIDSLHRAARERRSLRNEMFYDCHGHLGHCTPNHVVEHRVSDMVGEMDKFGVRTCCVFGLEGVFSDETYGNDLVAEAVRQHPGRFIGFTLVNLNHGEQLLRQELERGYEMGLRGVKLINSYHGYPEEGPLVDVACEFAHQRRLLILNHHWGSAAQIERLCRAWQNACFFTGHAAWGYDQVTRRVDNLFICTCPLLGFGQTEQYVKAYGAHRILFGSDLTDLPIGWGMAPVFYARISEGEKRQILGENLKQLLPKYNTGVKL